MPKINRYVDISSVDREAKKDYIDRHSPFIHCAETAKAGEKFPVTVKMGQLYPHPDDTEHYIKSIQLFNGDMLLAETNFVAGTLGGQGSKGHAEVTFNIIPSGVKLQLSAIAYCTKHGLWECDPISIAVESAA